MLTPLGDGISRQQRDQDFGRCGKNDVVYGSRATLRERLVESITERHQQLSTATQRVAHAFAAQNGLSERELQALIVVMQAEASGHPVTAGELGKAVRLSSAATTGIIDRLERAEHIERRRNAEDRRRVTLHYAPLGMRTAATFFAPLSDLSSAIMARFDDHSLEIIDRYLTEMTAAMSSRADAVEAKAATD